MRIKMMIMVLALLLAFRPGVPVHAGTIGAPAHHSMMPAGDAVAGGEHCHHDRTAYAPDKPHDTTHANGCAMALCCLQLAAEPALPIAMRLTAAPAHGDWHPDPLTGFEPAIPHGPPKTLRA